MSNLIVWHDFLAFERTTIIFLSQRILLSDQQACPLSCKLLEPHDLIVPSLKLEVWQKRTIENSFCSTYFLFPFSFSNCLFRFESKENSLWLHSDTVSTKALHRNLRFVKFTSWSSQCGHLQYDVYNFFVNTVRWLLSSSVRKLLD